jgi:CRISPR/Cas system CSM-associated protein Csm3 (group 7 of RAMP superfamily)
MTANKLYLGCGKIKVKARGYWFTAGGEKGSFGYYPHLKDHDSYPVYPDTQLHGDLRMASTWLQKLDKNMVPEDLLEKVFGKEGNRHASAFYLTDLTLTQDAKLSWHKARFEVKPRIQINDASRTVQEHMLVNLELAYLEKMVLETQVYLGYFSDVEKLEQAKKLVLEAAALLSGFGAFRSRGYGRGRITVTWGANKTLEYKQGPASQADAYTYTITALTNLRNRPIEPGKTQLAECQKHIASHQLRAWFARAYQELFGTWPTWEQMALIHFPTCYPYETSLCFPPACTTLRSEQGAMQDGFGHWGEEPESEEERQARENFYATKTRPLAATMFVTNQATPAVCEVKTVRRMRNAMDENFMTKKEAGLFVQEHIPSNTRFGGIIRLAASDGKSSEFLSKARFILENVQPTIHSTLFQPSLVPAPAVNANAGNQPRLVVAPIPWHPQLAKRAGQTYTQINHKVLAKDASQLIVATERQYNTRLQRPRRNRIVIAQRSLLQNTGEVWKDLVAEVTIEWQGLGKPISPLPAPTPSQQSSAPAEQAPAINPKWAKISNAQAGKLRGFLGLDKATLQQSVNEILAKYQQESMRESLLPQTLLAKIQTILAGDAEKNIPAGSLQDVRTLIYAVREAWALAEWEKKRPNVVQRFQQKQTEFAQTREGKA